MNPKRPNDYDKTMLFWLGVIAILVCYVLIRSLFFRDRFPVLPPTKLSATL